ncbi:TetR family transcriptional regulator [Lampropedia puyangensis]|uniref:TetR family transcriptional regulator n=1 Tax=Lampropedia puyangensis TaxID=1330072 RepID=A0A4S8EWP8_9BURK|nr:TetR family transcriptional regulator [Lampropedia puyangensis]THT98720.1 TetR family transcriptional regulator [Lampropedia puyangensis]
MTGAKGKRGAGDPGRRDHLIEAALSLMFIKGIKGVNHRTVAAKAGVPLGSTTYYFHDLDALLIASIERLTQRRQTEMDAWSERISSLDEMLVELADLIVKRLTRDRQETMLSYELYFLALRRPEFSHYSEASTQVLRDTIRRFANEKTTRTLTALVDGLVIEGLLSTHIPTAQDLLETMRVVATA